MNKRSSRRRSPAMRFLVLVLGAGLLLLSRYLTDSESGKASPRESNSPTSVATPKIGKASSSSAERSGGDYQTGRQRVLEAYENRESGIWVEADAQVFKTLRDDNEGSRHQKFLVDLDGHTLLISHNIDLAPRVPLREGDRVVFRGRYEWNDRGGVVHWTHRDPRGRTAGGWITHGSETYK